MEGEQITPKIRVMMVEESALVYRSIINILNEHTWIKVLDLIPPGRQALTSIAAESPDVVILDIGQSSGEGLGLLEEAKKRWTDLSVIMLSNSSDFAYKKKCVSLGADYFLDKSYDFSQLPEVIRGLSHIRNFRRSQPYYSSR